MPLSFRASAAADFRSTKTSRPDSAASTSKRRNVVLLISAAGKLMSA